MIYLIEGPDGSGKTTLIDTMVKERGAHVLKSSCDSLTGSIDNRAYLHWSIQTLPFLSDTKEIYVMNRHPIISDPIYSPALDRQTDVLDNPQLYYLAMGTLREHVTMILCMPPLDVVTKNVLSDPSAHMPGVAENIRGIYVAYEAFYESGVLPDIMLYDYTQSVSHG